MGHFIIPTYTVARSNAPDDCVLAFDVNQECVGSCEFDDIENGALRRMPEDVSSLLVHPSNLDRLNKLIRSTLH